MSRGGEFNHELDQNDNFSRDDRFLVFDTRTDAGGIVEGQSIGKIDVSSGDVTVLYEVPGANAFGPGSGAASYSPVEEVEKIVEVSELSAVEVTKKRVGDARKCKELEDKCARLETYVEQFDQRSLAVHV